MTVQTSKIAVRQPQASRIRRSELEAFTIAASFMFVGLIAGAVVHAFLAGSVPTTTAQNTSRSSIYWIQTSGTPSMEPAITGKVDLCVCSDVYHRGRPERGDVVQFPAQVPNTNYIKRIIGLPGETLAMRRGKVCICERGQWRLLEERYNTVQIADCTFATNCDSESVWYINIPEGHVFVMGDNRTNSHDSRHFGTVPISTILGKVIYPHL